MNLFLKLSSPMNTEPQQHLVRYCGGSHNLGAKTHAHQQKWEPARVCVAGTLVDVAGCWSIFWSRDICPKNRFVRVVGLFIGPLSLSHFTKPWMSKPWRVTDIVISLWLSLTNLFIHWTLWTDDINGSFNDMISRQTNYHLIYKLQTTNMIWYDMIRFVWFDMK